MILGIGIDSVEIERFKHWHTYNQKKLLRIFSEKEIEYCLQQKNKSAERFAARFAAKESFFKAFCSAYPTIYIPFLAMCKHISVKKHGQRPTIAVNWNGISAIVSLQEDFDSYMSLTHTRTLATAFVVIEKTRL